MPVRESFEVLRRQLESDELYCDMAIVSSFKSLYSRLLHHPLVLKLTEFVESDSRAALGVMEYAAGIVREALGSRRSEKDVALCASLVALAKSSYPAIEEFLSEMKSRSEVSLTWASEIARIAESRRIRMTLVVPPASGINMYVIDVSSKFRMPSDFAIITTSAAAPIYSMAQPRRDEFGLVGGSVTIERNFASTADPTYLVGN